MHLHQLIIVAGIMLVPLSALTQGATANKSPLAHTAQLLSEKKAVRIVCFGDSISEVKEGWWGGATKKEHNWGQQLGELLRKAYPQSDIQVMNAGIGGQNAYEGLGRCSELQELKPDLVLVEFGTNDCVYHFLQPDETQLALKSIAQAIKAQLGADVCIMGTGGDNPLDPFFVHLNETVQASRNAAADAGVPFIDMRAATLLLTENGKRWTDFFNGSKNCRRNDNGHHAWAETVFAAIRELMKASTG